MSEIGKPVEEQPETPKILEELSKSNLAKPANRQKLTARKRFIIVVCIFSVLLAGVVLLGYQQWTQQNRLVDLLDQNQRLSDMLSAQNAEIDQLHALQQQAQEPVPVDDSAMRELESQLNAEIARLRQQLAGVQQQQRAVNVEASLEWKILEAEYLLGIANQKLQLQADVASAIALLEDADAALVASGSAGVFATRQAIAADLQNLREVTPLDHAGIYLTLDALIEQVQAIDLPDSMRDNFETRRDPRNSATGSGSTDSAGVVDASLDFLRSVFVWRKWDETPVGMIAPGQDLLIKQNLQLVLEQGQLALLQRDGVLFRRSIENGLDWLTRYAAPDSATASNLRSNLTELLALDIDPPLPGLERTMSAIAQLSASER